MMPQQPGIEEGIFRTYPQITPAFLNAMIAAAKWVKAMCVEKSFSYLTCNFRNLLNQDKLTSTIHLRSLNSGFRSFSAISSPRGRT